MNKKITLISPFSTIHSFGLRCISSCLKKEGFDVNLLFMPISFTKKYEENVLNDMIEVSKDSFLIGISTMSNYFDNIVKITKKIKTELEDTVVVWGGIHSTIKPLECLDYADAVCIGEGEESIIELAKKIRNEESYYDTDGIWFNNDGKIIKNVIRPLIQNLDSIPFQDYDYKSHYIIDNHYIKRMDLGLLNKYIEGVYLTMATRGCPHRCTFCCNNFFNKMYVGQKIVRKRSADNIIKELLQIKKIAKCIRFDDDAFCIQSLEEIKKFSILYKENIDLPFIVTGATPLTLTRDKLSFLVDAGLIEIRMGIQTGSKKTQKLYNRQFSNQQIMSVAKIINEFNGKIKPPRYDIILDNPYETEKELNETLLLLNSLPVPYHLNIFSLVFFPATEMYDRAKKDNLITDEINEIYHKSYRTSSNTYYNRLFFLLQNYAKSNKKIRKNIMELLVNPKMQRLKLNWLIYYLLYMKSVYYRTKYLSHEFLKDLRHNNLDRIITYIKATIMKTNDELTDKIKGEDKRL